MRKSRLFTPGPTPLAPSAQLAMARPLIHHRTPEFQEIFRQTRDNLKAIFRTENDLIILASTGTGAMEASVANLMGPGDEALCVMAGKFGERWGEICRKFGVSVHELQKDYGQAASVDEIRQALGEHSETTALLLQGCETSTGTAHNLEEIGFLIRNEFPRVLTIVDGITTVACQRLETDAWGLDIVVSGSQKAFAAPPGLAFLSISPRALERMRKRRGPVFYFDLVKEAKAQSTGKTAYTAAVPLVCALLETSREILDQGLDDFIRETARGAKAVRSGLHALGFRLLSAAPANAVTACYPPDGIDAAQLAGHLQERFGLKVAGGQGALKGRIVRIAHLGNFDLLDAFTVLSAIELSLVDLGLEFEAGQGLSAALRASREN